MRQFMELRKSKIVGCIASPVETDVLLWKAQINGPEDSTWEGGVFKLEMRFSEEYPDEPPKVKFLTKMFHPNIYENGDICVDMLQKGWVATYGVENILISLQVCLCGETLLNNVHTDTCADTCTDTCTDTHARTKERKGGIPNAPPVVTEC